MHHYDGSNVDLGTAAGKLYRVGVMSIQDAGDSDLVSCCGPIFVAEQKLTRLAAIRDCLECIVPLCYPGFCRYYCVRWGEDTEGGVNLVTWL